MTQAIESLALFQQLRLRQVDSLTGELGQQKSLCQRYQRTLAALAGLYESTRQPEGGLAIQLNNQCGYKHHIQRLIDWQKQEQILADKQQQRLQRLLLAEARREKAVECVLNEQYLAQSRETQRREQKVTDAQSVQCWMRLQALKK